MTTRRYSGTWTVSIDIDEPPEVGAARRHEYQEELMRKMHAFLVETQLANGLRDGLGEMLDDRRAERVVIAPFPISHPDSGKTWHGARRPDRQKARER
jgi:hypothetical protein